jgi:hypothetical protein
MERQHIQFNMSFYIEEDGDGYVAYPEHAEEIQCRGEEKWQAAEKLMVTTLTYMDELWD